MTSLKIIYDNLELLFYNITLIVIYFYNRREYNIIFANTNLTFINDTRNKYQNILDIDETCRIERLE